MALEVMKKVVVDDLQKPKKKKVETMDTELRTNVPVKQVKKEDQDFINAMEDARKKTALEIAKKNIKKP